MTFDLSPRDSRPWRRAMFAVAGMAALTAAIAAACRRIPEPAEPPPAAAASLETTPPAPVEDASYGLRPAEKTAVAAFLRVHTDLRAATDEDRRPSLDGDDIASLYGVYHPYFVRGDVNDDGVLDFVLAFVRRDSDGETPWFSVAVFSGESRGGFSPGVFLERDVSLADGDLSVDRDTVVVTPDVADEASRRYRWDPERRRHVFMHDAPEEPPSLPSAQT
jgi:hypothetical protein